MVSNENKTVLEKLKSIGCEPKPFQFSNKEMTNFDVAGVLSAILKVVLKNNSWDNIAVEEVANECEHLSDAMIILGLETIKESGMIDYSNDYVYLIIKQKLINMYARHWGLEVSENQNQGK